MTPRAMRKAERVVHLFWGIVLVLYVYGLLPSWGQPVVRWWPEVPRMEHRASPQVGVRRAPWSRAAPNLGCAREWTDVLRKEMGR